MSEAMHQVRDALGDDAIIVSTREEKSGLVKITAAVEKTDTLPDTPVVAQTAPAGMTDEEITESITDAMLRHRVPSSVSEKIIGAAMTLTGTTPQQVLTKALEKTLRFQPRDQHAALPNLMLVGPPGAGKTLMTAKLAAQAALEGRTPIVVTTDIARAGGMEQLAAFLRILNLPLYKAEDETELKELMSGVEPNSEVIVDTGGLNPFDPKEMAFLAKLIKTGNFTPTLVLPAGTDAEESAEIALTFEVLGVKQLIPTRLDFSRHLGGILSAADRAGLTFTEASHTPNVAHGILYLDPPTLADLLMPNPNKNGKMKA